MKILAALDTSTQSFFVVNEVARLAASTWADVTLLGIEPEAALTDQPPFTAEDRTNADHPLVKALRQYRKSFLEHFDFEGSPYTNSTISKELVELHSGCWEDLEVRRGAMKQLKTRLRSGNPARAVLAEAKESECDLIVIGNAVTTGKELTKSVKKILLEAHSSVLVVAESKKPRRIAACLDHDNVSQPSLEMINQMVTLYGADLEVVGVTSHETLSHDVDHKMGEILKYYAANKVKALARLVEGNLLETFAAEAAHENLVALWMGKQSLLSKFFHPRNFDKLLSSAESSLLILR